MMIDDLTSIMRGLVLLVGTASTVLVGVSPSAGSTRVAEEIRREALLPPNGPAGRPLPLVSHWNMGSQGRGWTPQYQIELLGQGHHILPWLGWPQTDPLKKEQSAKQFHDYYDGLLGYCREFGLPISFRGTQWEAMLVGKEYRSLSPEQCPAVTTPEGEVLAKLCPFGPVEPWQDPAEEYVDTAGMKELQRMYPDPPLVLFVSNNEAPDLRWHQVEQSKRYLDKYGPGRSDEFKRQVVARGWMERYPVMFKAMREALVNESWKKNVRFVGYGAFGPSHFGRWEGWKQYSLITDQWTSPDWHIWDGGSPSYYTHNWDDSRDHWVWSTQVESMNWIFMLEEAWSVNPDFWWEVSLWDGNASDWTPQTECTPENTKKSKACQYKNDGQTYSPDRFEGWAQFGLWLLRPRAIREFRGSTTPLEPWRPFFDRLLSAVDRVWANETLRDFWRFGELVPNRAHQHPYQVDIPEKYRDIQRWFLLDTSLDALRPWDQRTNIPVFSLSLVRGDEGKRRWLVYAHSPLDNRRAVRIMVPEYGEITVDVPRAGTFYSIDQQQKKVTPVVAASGK
ncbi:MAG: hypothetical protein A2Y76_08360 [Planctomycetes bacterium RBG_13_60_9]|nr:MAG: hypothetical protein A2Y76_08360 [Planctomycetes bacterium RBG_13_60_9]